MGAAVTIYIKLHNQRTNVVGFGRGSPTQLHSFKGIL